MPHLPPPAFDSIDVRRYYDRHTRGFLAFGEGGRLGAIRRAVWAPGVSSSDGAFHFVDDLVADAIVSRPDRPAAPHVVDLGCGVGGSLLRLTTRVSRARGTGVTLSRLQARLAAQRFDEAGAGARVTCLIANFEALPIAAASADAVCAIESFAHAQDPARFFVEAARALRPGGLLAVCDDFLRPSRERAAERWVDLLRRSWRLNTLITTDAAIGAAARAGLSHRSTTTLTPWLNVDRLRDRVLAVLAHALGWLPSASDRFGHLVGGNALRRCLAGGWIGYDLLLFERGPERP